jgi:hypothetical protein
MFFCSKIRITLVFSFFAICRSPSSAQQSRHPAGPVFFGTNQPDHPLIFPAAQ